MIAEALASAANRLHIYICTLNLPLLLAQCIPANQCKPGSLPSRQVTAHSETSAVRAMERAEIVRACVRACVRESVQRARGAAHNIDFRKCSLAAQGRDPAGSHSWGREGWARAERPTGEIKSFTNATWWWNPTHDPRKRCARARTQAASGPVSLCGPIPPPGRPPRRGRF